MRFLRAFTAAAGASGSIIAAGGIVLALLSGALAFHGWPGMRGPQGGLGATEIPRDASAAAAHAVASARRVASVSTLPAVPVAARRSTSGGAPRDATRRRARVRRQRAAVSARGGAQGSPSGGAAAGPPAAATGPAVTPSVVATRPPSGSSPSSSSSGSSGGGGAGGGPAPSTPS